MIYLDLCCLKRPFDDQRQARIRREAGAVAAIIEAAERGVVELVRSPVLALENDGNPREDRRVAASLWLNGATVFVPPSDAVDVRARALVGWGFGVLDALHVAFAEAAGADYLATCDDGLLRLGRARRGRLRVRIVNPVDIPSGFGA